MASKDVCTKSKYNPGLTLTYRKYWLANPVSILGYTLNARHQSLLLERPGFQGNVCQTQFHDGSLLFGQGPIPTKNQSVASVGKPYSGFHLLDFLQGRSQLHWFLLQKDRGKQREFSPSGLARSFVFRSLSAPREGAPQSALRRPVLRGPAPASHTLPQSKDLLREAGNEGMNRGIPESRKHQGWFIRVIPDQRHGKQVH